MRARWYEAMIWITDHIGYQGKDCLIWPYGKDPGGYGRVRIGKRTAPVHRVMCLMAHGDPPLNKTHATHICGNPLCVSPLHLRWNNNQGNMRDKLRHGTYGIKLSLEKATEIRVLKGRLTQRAIAKRFGISQPAVCHILTGEAW